MFCNKLINVHKYICFINVRIFVPNAPANEKLFWIMYLEASPFDQVPNRLGLAEKSDMEPIFCTRCIRRKYQQIKLGIMSQIRKKCTMENKLLTDDKEGSPENYLRKYVYNGKGCRWR